MEICHQLEIGTDRDRRLQQVFRYRDRGKGHGGEEGEGGFPERNGSLWQVLHYRDGGKDLRRGGRGEDLQLASLLLSPEWLKSVLIRSAIFY